MRSTLAPSRSPARYRSRAWSRRAEICVVSAAAATAPARVVAHRLPQRRDSLPDPRHRLAPPHRLTDLPEHLFQVPRAPGGYLSADRDLHAAVLERAEKRDRKSTRL